MIPKVQWILRLVGFIVIGASLFAGEHASLVGAIGAMLFLLGMIRLKKK